MRAREAEAAEREGLGGGRTCRLKGEPRPLWEGMRHEAGSGKPPRDAKAALRGAPARPEPSDLVQGGGGGGVFGRWGRRGRLCSEPPRGEPRGRATVAKLS